MKKTRKKKLAYREIKNIKQKLLDQKITNGVFKAYLKIMKLVSNRTRWRILAHLTEKGTITWPEMEHELDINPNMIRHHTTQLLEAGLIEQSNPGFRLTKAGYAVMTMSLEDMITVAKIGVGLATTEEKEVGNG